MNTSKFLAIGLCGLYACGGGTQHAPPSLPDAPLTQERIDSIVSAYSFVYEPPIIPDSGSHALIPMSIRDDGRSKKIGRLSSYSYEESYSPRYWNVLFLDLHTQRTHLLTEKKTRIDAIHVHGREKGKLLARRVLYTLTEEDVNGDGKLDHDDPSHLSISSGDGSGLTHISPLDENLLGWDVLGNHDRILVRTRTDMNGDGKYEAHEDMRVYVYDVATHELHPVVARDLQQKVNSLFFEQWLKKN